MINIGVYEKNVVIQMTDGDVTITKILSIEAANIMAKRLVDSVKEVKQQMKATDLSKKAKG